MSEFDVYRIANKVDALIQELHNLNVSTIPNIVVYGLLNSGKSSLLNVLTEHLSDEYFKTADIRETTSRKTLTHNNLNFIDTPGLDASMIDDLEAAEGLKSGDYILYVHQIPGELERIEIDFLKKAKDLLGRVASDNIIIIISKIDNEQDTSKLEKIQSAIINQCKVFLDFQPKTLLVSSKRYQKGKQDNKNLLINKSGITELLEKLANVKNDFAQVRDLIIEAKTTSITGELKKIDSMLDEQSNAISHNPESELNRVKKDYENYKTQNKQYKDNIKELESELKNITNQLKELN